MQRLQNGQRVQIISKDPTIYSSDGSEFNVGDLGTIKSQSNGEKYWVSLTNQSGKYFEILIDRIHLQTVNRLILPPPAPALPPPPAPIKRCYRPEQYLGKYVKIISNIFNSPELNIGSFGTVIGMVEDRHQIRFQNGKVLNVHESDFEVVPQLNSSGMNGGSSNNLRDGLIQQKMVKYMKKINLIGGVLPPDLAKPIRPLCAPGPNKSHKIFIYAHALMAGRPFLLKKGRSLITFFDLGVLTPMDLQFEKETRDFYQAGNTFFENDDKSYTETPGVDSFRTKFAANPSSPPLKIRNHIGEKLVNDQILQLNCPLRHCSIHCITPGNIIIHYPVQFIKSADNGAGTKGENIDTILLSDLIDYIIGDNPPPDEYYTFFINTCRGCAHLPPPIAAATRQISALADEDKK